MTAVAVVRSVGDIVTSLALGAAEGVAIVLSAVAMVLIVIVSQVVRITLELAERRTLRRAARRRIMRAGPQPVTLSP